MNSPYSTPCKPSECDKYTIDGCNRQATCDKFIKYTELKQSIKTESSTYYKLYTKREKSVDLHFRQSTPVKRSSL